MNCKLFILYLLWTSCFNSSYAQITDANFLLPPFIENSAIRNMELADSFSVAGDSINASRHFSKIDPYFFISTNRTLETIDSGFAAYLLTSQAMKEYRKVFTRAYQTERTEAYRTFKVMLEEDQTTRRKLSWCKDSILCTEMEQILVRTDSFHFEYLYKYVRNNGWPTYENGSFFAEIIAIHDGKHMQFYLPHIKRAVIAGYSSSRFYSNILNRAKPSKFEQLRNHKNKLTFDVSYVLKGKEASAAQIKEIQKAVVDCGPIKHQYIVYESADEKDYRKFMSMSQNQNYWLAWHILVEIGHSQKSNVPYSFLYSETISKQNKLKVILVY
jgi:hypothetical protein